jgi:HemY protein
MTRLIAFLVAIVAVAAGLHWLADRPGTVVVEWQDYVAETSVFRAFVMLVATIGAILLVWSILRWLWASPASLGRLLHRRREQRGLDALSSGMIAIGAGDRSLALRYAGQARKALPNEPLTHLLRAQTAQLTGDRPTARRIFEAMLASPDTEQLGLRGLFLEAEREREPEAARQFAQRALGLNPKLGWPVEALFDLQCKAGDWQGALDTLAIGRRQELITRPVADRRRAVLLTAQAQAAEDTAPDKALELALEAHRLAVDLVPAAAIAGRILASRGNTPRAARVLLKTWRVSPHPDLAATYAYARPGDSPRDRLNRMRHLGRMTPHNNEGPIALAITAIEAREWDEARKALEPLLADRLTQRVCTLMARIESESQGHTGRVREWLARAVNAPRDPAWTADGTVADHWAPVSPSGTLDAFSWRVPVEAIDAPVGALLAAKMEELVSLGAAGDPALVHAKADGHTAAEVLEPVERTMPAAAPPIVVVPAASPAAAVRPSAPSVPPAPQPAARTSVGIEPVPMRPGAAAADDQLTGEAVGPKIAAKVAAPRRTERPPGRTRPAVETKIFVPPHAPDDPGPEAAADELEIGAFRPSGAKA